MKSSAAVKTAVVEDIPVIQGQAPIVRALLENHGVPDLWSSLLSRVTSSISDAAAFMDVSILLRASGMQDQARQCQMAALENSRLFLIRNGDGKGPTVLAYVTAGDFMANTPVEFLLDYSNCNLILYYVDAATADLTDIPAHDVAIVAVGQTETNLPVLDRLAQLLDGWSGPVINQDMHRIRALSRDGLAEAFRNDPHVLVPQTVRIGRTALLALAKGRAAVADHLPGCHFPVVIRPVGFHAGRGLQKIDTSEELLAYLGRQTELDFFLQPFIDYAGKDGLFRKQRIAFINGRAYPSHLAISDDWMVRYLNAGMAEHVERQVEEADWLDNFQRAFALRHAHAFDALHRRIGLDYFVIDCAELEDGRLVVFQADVAMIVHAMDPQTQFVYKQNATLHLFAAFERALRKVIARASGHAAVTCAHSGKPAVYQRTGDDSLICALAMYTGKSYEEIQALARDCDPAFPLGGPMSHSIMRAVANSCGTVLLSSIYMLWNSPAIIGLVSPTLVDTGHAVFWDGEKIIDPGRSDRVDRAYVDRCGLEFTQRASDLQPLIAHDEAISYKAGATSTGEML